MQWALNIIQTESRKGDKIVCRTDKKGMMMMMRCLREEIFDNIWRVVYDSQYNSQHECSYININEMAKNAFSRGELWSDAW